MNNLYPITPSLLPPTTTYLLSLSYLELAKRTFGAPRAQPTSSSALSGRTKKLELKMSSNLCVRVHYFLGRARALVYIFEPTSFRLGALSGWTKKTQIKDKLKFIYPNLLFFRFFCLIHQTRLILPAVPLKFE